MLLQVSPKEEVLSRPLKPGGIPLDVALIMLDSVSDAHFRRKMPNTLKYLIEHQTTVFLQGLVTVSFFIPVFMLANVSLRQNSELKLTANTNILTPTNFQARQLLGMEQQPQCRLCSPG